MQENIVSFSKKEKIKKNLNLQDPKLQCFNGMLDKLKIDLNKFDFKNYTRPDFQVRSVLFGIVNRDKGIDLRMNAIYNVLDNVKLRGNSDVNGNNYRADLIILNIATQLFDYKFNGRKLNCANPDDIRDTLVWSHYAYLIDQLSVFYYAYVNTDIKTCQIVARADENPIQYDGVARNIQLLSASFVNSLPKESHHQILDTMINSEFICPQLEDEFYQNARKICEINPNFFSNFDAILTLNCKEVLKIFTLEELANMKQEELCYISSKSEPQLKKMKPLLELGIDFSKIDKIVCYPIMIQIGYQKIKWIKNQLSNTYNSNKVLSKK